MPTLRALADQALLEYVRSAARRARIVGSTCTGALILAAAGLLNGRRATTHWGFHRVLERLGATYVPERWVQDERFITAAGISAGIDMALHVAQRLTDERVARQVQLILEYDPQPPLGGIDWSQVDRNAMDPVVADMMRTAFAAHPELAAKLLDL
ncbi:MAG: hypothetical protein A2133_03390 [Actinobacteria bacterium RBG_16_64_13]|nr:MAG: hypothetical protein A2133_03390 [Actinobacteria bacterium RBG_16_64_13]